MTFSHYRWQDLSSMLLMATVYALLAKLMLSYFSVAENVTLVWFPGGVALSVLLLKGLRLWPGVFVGAFAAGLLVNDGFWLCFVTAVGNTLESVLAAWLLNRSHRFSLDLAKPEHLRTLTLVGAFCSIISAVFGPVAMGLQGMFPVQALPPVILHWWMADMFGMITITPVFLIWRHWPSEWFQGKRGFEALGFIGLTVFVTLLVFQDVFQKQITDLPHAYWMIAFLFWGAMRFGRHGVQFVVILTAITALLGAAAGKGVFSDDFENSGLLNFWLFQSLFSWIGSVLALTLHDLREAGNFLRSNERRLDAIINASPVAYALNDDQFNITQLNPAFIKTFGYTLADISTLADWWTKACPDPEYRRWVETRWHQAKQSGQAFQSFELDVHCKNGEIKHILVGAVPLEGIYSGEHLVTMLDLTEQYHANKILIDTNILLQTILETLPLRVFWKDQQSRYLGANHLFAQDVGLDSVTELLGKNDFQLRSYEQATLCQADDLQVMQSGVSRLAYEEQQTTPTGEKIWLRTSKLPLRNSEQQIIGVMGVYEDITMRKRLDDQLLWRTTFMETLLDSSPDGVLVVDAEGNQLIQNQRVSELWGMPAEIASQSDDSVQLEFVKQRLKNPVQFLQQVTRYYNDTALTGCDEIELVDGVVLERFTAPVRDRLGQYYGRIWHFTDVTEVRQTQKVLVQKQYYQRALLDNFPFLVWLKDKNYRYLAANRVFAEQLGISVDQIIGKTDFDIFPVDLAQRYQADDRSVMDSKQQLHTEEQMRLFGEYRWVETHKSPLLDDQNQVLGIVGFSRDISQRKESEEALKLSALVFENSSEAMLVTDADNKVLNVNAAFTQMTGYTAEDVLGKDPKMLSSGEHDPAFYQAMWQSINATGTWHGELKNRRKSGEVYIEETFINTIYDNDNKPQRRVALFSDITQRKQTEEQIWRHANFDPLTGLLNRRMVRERIEQEIKISHRMQQRFGLLIIDLDHFKEVNDTLGHEMGDELLQQAAQRLLSCVRESDVVARLGGDEFTIVLNEIDSVNSPERVAKELVHQMSLPFTLGDEQVYVSASIGITLYPEDGQELSQLLRNADQAMYAAKSQGRNCYSFFTQSMQIALSARAAMINDLRGALAKQEFKLVYQPIVELANGRIYKAEALLRWLHPQRGLVSPAEFVPLAEETGLIHEIGDWVFHTAAAQVGIWRKSLHADFQVGINKSPLQFLDARHNPADWIDFLQSVDLPGQAIVVEITEGLLLEASQKTAVHLLVFRDAGVQVAIDDFGTGYSALSYLKKFDIDYLKIDQSFVRNLSAESSDFVLCEAIIVMAHKLGLKVIAEGVETELQRDLLVSVACDYGQGYLFAKPMPAEEFEAQWRS
ncbi:MAG: PAS domain S-box protein [Methylomonas lenta]|nr:PAS domain S-box protein [Methylomonas lenta]